MGKLEAAVLFQSFTTQRGPDLLLMGCFTVEEVQQFNMKSSSSTIKSRRYFLVAAPVKLTMTSHGAVWKWPLNFCENSHQFILFVTWSNMFVCLLFRSAFQLDYI